MDVFIQQSINGLALGATYAVFAVGFTLLFGVLNVLNLAQGSLLMVGGFAGLELTLVLGWPLLPAFVAAMLISGAVAVAAELLFFGPLERRGANRWMGLVASLAVARLLIAVVQETFGTQVRRFPAQDWMQWAWDVGGVRIQVLQVLIIGSALVLMAALAWLLRRTRTGQAIRTLAFSPDVARLVGVPVRRIKLFTYFLTGALAGAAGVQLGVLYNAVSPFMGENILLKGLSALILGGLGHVPGAAIGGLALGLTEVYSVAYLKSSLRDAIAFGAIFAVLLFRPQGLFGRATRQRA
ncbi:High-affinity branched-chain amino acid transport system permease protein LivH (TC 3.A.1.4.1) [plant metagenome]|uniref:High-affinity branched-chain amino acid transport system permease protein LivH (TC 3.A.1.4.1) n=1 Tax=plant metagenome TaxID=1297885 RepID=A0A484Q897_9ZZZZ